MTFGQTLFRAIVRVAVASTCLPAVAVVPRRASPAAAACAGQMTTTLPAAGAYAVRLAAGPFRRQVGNTCRYEATLAHLENVVGTSFSSDYLNVERMRRTTEQYLDDAAAEIDGWTIRTGGRVDVVEPPPTEVRDCFDETLNVIRAVAGLVPTAAFTFPPDLTADLRAWARRVAVDDPLVDPDALSPVQLLNLRVGTILRDVWRMIRAGEDAEANVAAARALTDDLYARALGGLDPTIDARATTGAAIMKRRLVQAGPSYRHRGSSVADAERVVRTYLDAGRTVVAYVYWRKDVLDVEANAFYPPKNVARERAFVDDQWQKLTGHAVVVNGYALDRAGRIEWLRLQDSRETSRGSGGLVHMHVEYFRSHLHSVNAIALP